MAEKKVSDEIKISESVMSAALAPKRINVLIHKTNSN